MPELPEVETTLRGILPHLLHRTLTGAVVRDSRLRWPVDENLGERLQGNSVRGLQRRGKYLLLQLDAATLLIHLGMSGSLRICRRDEPAGKHDHIDLLIEHEHILRYRDPRRFGAVLWITGNAARHPLLAGLGPEPLGEVFDGSYLYHSSRHRRTAVKAFIMDSRVVVGVGNIYANEALFFSGIDPRRAAGKISLARYQQLATTIRRVLTDAIAQGGTTLRDFVGGDGQPGYFALRLAVYGRGGEPCTVCGGPLQELRLAQRSTVFCSRCQH